MKNERNRETEREKKRKIRCERKQRDKRDGKWPKNGGKRRHKKGSEHNVPFHTSSERETPGLRSPHVILTLPIVGEREREREREKERKSERKRESCDGRVKTNGENRNGFLQPFKKRKG